MNSGGVQIRVSDMLFILNKRWKMILSLTMLGLVFGVVIFTMTYVQDSVRSYEVSGSLAISTQNHSDGVYINGSQVANNNDFHLAEDMADAVTYVLRSDVVLNQVITDQGLLGTTVEDLRAGLTVNQYQSTQILEMHFTWRTAEEAQSIWQAIVDAANQIIPETLQLGQLAVINPPQAVQSSAAGSGRILPVLFMLLGLCAGIGAAAMELIVRPTLTNTKDAETMFGLETIGIIPRDDAFFRSRQGAMLDAAGPDRSNILQNYSAAAYILCNRLSSKEAHHCFYVTSTTTGEGKTCVAANLAVQLSDMEHKTLLIDLDTRNPSLGSLFMEKVDYAHSLNALYRGDAIEEDVIAPMTGYLDLLPAVLEHNAIALDGAVTDMIQRLSERYEYIILDTAPVGEVSEIMGLNRVATNVLYVIEYDSTPLPAIQTSLEKLDKSGIRVLGCVINAVGSAVKSKGRSTAKARKDKAAGKAGKKNDRTKEKKTTKTKKKETTRKERLSRDDVKPGSVEEEKTGSPKTAKQSRQEAARAKKRKKKEKRRARKRTGGFLFWGSSKKKKKKNKNRQSIEEQGLTESSKVTASAAAPLSALSEEERAAHPAAEGKNVLESLGAAGAANTPNTLADLMSDQNTWQKDNRSDTSVMDALAQQALDAKRKE